MTRKTIEVSENAWKFFKENRGSGSIKEFVDKVIAKYKEGEQYVVK